MANPLVSKGAIAAYGLAGTGLFAWNARKKEKAAQEVRAALLTVEAQMTGLKQELATTQEQLRIALTCQPSQEEFARLHRRLEQAEKREGAFSDGSLAGLFGALLGVGAGALVMGIGQMR